MSEHAKQVHHGSLRSYLIGFALSVILTVIPFWLVMNDVIANPNSSIPIIFALGAAQMLVHLHYFMHVNVDVEAGWQMMAGVLTVILIVIIMAGSLWIIGHLETNMMPEHEQIERIRALP